MLSLRRDETARIFLIAGLLAVHAAVWLLALSLGSGSAPQRQIVAEMMSTSALVLMSLNLMLSTRLPILERMLVGLDKLFATHRTVGLAVVLFVVAHFIIVPRSDGLVPTKFFSLPTFFLLLAAIFVAVAPRFPWKRLVPLKYHTWKLTHRFMGVFVLTAAIHSLLAKTYVRQVPFLAAWVYGMAGLGLVAYAYRELAFLRSPTRVGIDSFRVIGDISEVTLSRTPHLPRRAGQFVVLSFAEGPSREQHPFTVSSGSREPHRFSIKGSGDFTDRLAADGLRVGSEVSVEGPYGAFDHRRGKQRQLWLAGGIGITPFLAMAADLGETTEVLLIWSVHDRTEAVYEDELLGLSERRPNLTFVIHPTSELGHLSLARLDLASPSKDYSAFICGPRAMIESFDKQLRRLGVPRDQIYFEEFRLR